MKTKHFAIFLIMLALAAVFASCNTEDTTATGEATSASTGETTTETTVVTTTAAIQTTDKNFTTVTTTKATTTKAKTTKGESSMATTTVATTTIATTTTKATTTKVTQPLIAISLDKSAATLKVGDTLTLNARVSNALVDSTVAWSSSDENVATVQNGKVTPVSAGIAKIYATASNGDKVYCAVNVTAYDIDVPRNTLNMLPVKVASSNTGVASASVLSGYMGINIRGVGQGSSTITVYDDFGNNMTFNVTVDASKNVKLSTITPFSKAKTVNVIFDYKAIPNDGYSDTTEVQKAIDKISSIGGGTVYVPRGTYNIALLQMKEGVTLKLAGNVDDVTKGYTAEVKARVDGGEFAVFKTTGGDMFRNVIAGSHGLTGIDNFHITGGVYDMQGTSRCILFVCADNASMTNCIIKDCLNDHAIQVTGSTNITIKDIMFAGYKIKDTSPNLTTGEEVQIEAGVNGATGGDIAVFGDKESYPSKNVLIDHCYFGPSDKYGSQTIAIGHHGYRHESDANGLTISNCVFDNNKTWSIKTASYSNTKIINNTFISESDNRVAYNNYESFIYITLANSDVTGKPTSSSSTATLAKKQSCEGSQNIEISGNSFTMSGAVVSRYVIYANSNEAYRNTVGAETVTNMLKYIKYGTPAQRYTGYIPVQNVIYNLVVKNNTIDIKCNSAGSGNLAKYFLKFNHVVGLTMADNKITSNVTFKDSNAHNNINGVSIYNCLFGKDMYTRTIKMNAFSDSSIGVMLPNSSGTNVKLTANEAQNLVLKSDGNGEIVLVYGDNGSVTVTFVPKAGYRFTGWTKDGEAYNPTADTVITASTTLVANFAK